MRWSFDWRLPSSSNIPATRSSPGSLPPTSSRKSKVSHFVCTLTYVLCATVNECISYLSASNVYREAFLKNGWHRENFSGFILCVIAEMRSNGVVPANYLLEGLKEMAFTLGSWTRTKEVSSTTSTQNKLCMH